MKKLEFDYQVRKSARKKTLTITVHLDNRVVVSAPATYPKKKILQFVEKNRTGFEKQFRPTSKAISKAGEGDSKPERNYFPGQGICFAGRTWNPSASHPGRWAYLRARAGRRCRAGAFSGKKASARMVSGVRPGQSKGKGPVLRRSGRRKTSSCGRQVIEVAVG